METTGITEKTTAELIAFRVSKGFNEAESKALLNELIEQFLAGRNLSAALKFQAFTNSNNLIDVKS